MDRLDRQIEKAGKPADQVAWLGAHRLISVPELLVERGLLSDDIARLARSISSKWPVVSGAQLAEETRVLGAFIAGGLPALALKGCLVAALVYPARDQRWRADLDVLVAPAAVPAAREVLRSLEYQPFFDVAGGTPMHQESWKTIKSGQRYVVDLHWRLRNHPLLVDRLGFDEQWEAAVPLPAIGDGVKGQCQIHALVSACMHWFDNLYAPERPLGWLLDKDLLWRQLDSTQRDALFSLACERELAGLLGESLRITRLAFQTPVPDHYIRELVAAGRSQKPTRLIDIGRSPWRAYWFALISEQGVMGKLERLRKSLFPPPRYMRQRYPEGSAFGLAGLYWKRVWRRIR